MEVLKGKVNVKLVFEPRFNYARTETQLEKHNSGIIARGDGEGITLSCTRELSIHDRKAEAEWTLSEGDGVWTHLRYGENEFVQLNQGKAKTSLADTETYWKNWLNKSETGSTLNLGHYRKRIERSALVLKLLYYEPSGTIAAAATTSLPEEVDGVRNWDYRYTWVRDASFTLQALFNLGHMSETEGYLRWIEKLLSEHGAEKLQIMYGLRGEEELPEEELAHLDGYKGSRPVRIGNEAAKQRQLDPRIHFALVCASSSCPPIDFYTAEKLDEELDISGKTFLNSGGIIIDRAGKHVSLSRIFKWYGSDFGKDPAVRLRFIAAFMYSEDDRRFLIENSEHIKIDYQDYDWRLNRY